MGRPLRFTTSQPTKALRKGDVAMRTRKGDLGPTASTKYYNAINPTEIGKYVVYEVIDATTAPRCYTPQDDEEFVRLCNQLGGSVTDVTSGLNYIADQSDLMVGSLINVTGSSATTVNPIALYMELGSNPGVQNKWFNTKSPDNLIGLNVATENDAPQPSLSEWICLETTNSVKYAAPYTGTVIYEIDTSGNTTTLVSATSSPSNGSFNVVQNRKYVANKPIHLFRSSRQDIMMPLAVSGYNWGFYFSRNEPITVNLYCVDDCTVRVFASPQLTNKVGEVSLTGGVTNTFVFSDDTFDNDRINIYGSVPFIASITGTGGDRSGAALAGAVSYRRDSGGLNSTVQGTTPATINTNAVTDDDLDTWAFDIGDGAGGDSEQSAPLHMLNQNYTLGDELESYKIVSPYDQTVTISSWNGSAWVEFSSHTLSGAGLNTPATAESGSQQGGTPFNSNTLWKFEGTKPYYLCVNEASADEETLFGWNSGAVEAFFL